MALNPNMFMAGDEKDAGDKKGEEPKKRRGRVSKWEKMLENMDGHHPNPERKTLNELNIMPEGTLDKYTDE